MKAALTLVKVEIYCHVNGEEVNGPPPGVRGNLTGVCGNLTGVCGDLTDVRGNLTGVRGNLTGVCGNLTDVWGNVDVCEITDAERQSGVDVSLLIEQALEATEKEGVVL